MCKTELRKEIERRESCNNRAPFPVYDTEVIQDLKILENMKNEENYDSEKVSYCKTCLSLDMYAEKYGDKFLERNKKD